MQLNNDFRTLTRDYERMISVFFTEINIFLRIIFTLFTLLLLAISLSLLFKGNFKGSAFFLVLTLVVVLVGLLN